MSGCLRQKLPARLLGRGLAFGHCREQAGRAGPGDTLYSDSEASGPKQRRGPQGEGLVPIPVLNSALPCESGTGRCSAGRRDGQRRQVAEAGRFQTSKRKTFLTVLGPERGRRLGRGGLVARGAPAKAVIPETREADSPAEPPPSPLQAGDHLPATRGYPGPTHPTGAKRVKGSSSAPRGLGAEA